MTTFEDKRTGTPTEVVVKTYGAKTAEPFTVLRVKVGDTPAYEYMTTDPEAFFAQVATAKAAWEAREVRPVTRGESRGQLITSVKLCRTPDAVCIEGGCGYCSTNPDAKFWTIPALHTYAHEHGMDAAFQYGYDSQWPNREKKYRSL